MIRAALAVLAGILFGAGLAWSGMVDPMRVRAFLDPFGGHWDPSLAFVMVGALIPMAIAWRLRARMAAPFCAESFHVPETRSITARLIVGAVLFGIGWGIAGLCPGPALADLSLDPPRASIFILAMAFGLAAERLARTAARHLSVLQGN